LLVLSTSVGEENKKIMVKPKNETEKIIIQAMKSVLVTVKDKTVTVYLEKKLINVTNVLT